MRAVMQQFMLLLNANLTLAEFEVEYLTEMFRVRGVTVFAYTKEDADVKNIFCP